MATVTVEQAEPGAEASKPPPRDEGRHQSRADVRAALLAEMEQAGKAERQAIEAEDAAQTEERRKAVEAIEAKPDPEEKPEEPSEDSDDADDEDDEEAAEETAPSTKKPDKELDKRLEQIRRAEKKSRADIAEAKAEFQTQVTRAKLELAQAQRQIEDFERLKTRARTNLPAVLRALGLTDDDFEPAAKLLYEESPTGKADPKVKARLGARDLRARESEEQVSALAQQVQELTRTIRERDERETLQREANAFLDRVEKQMNGENPLLAQLKGKSPARFRSLLGQVTQKLIEETDEAPDIEDVLQEAERFRRAQLEDEGIDVDSLIAKPAPAAERKPGKTLQGGGGAPPPTPKKKQSRKEVEQETLAMMREGRFDDD